MPPVGLPRDATAPKACRVFIWYKADTEPDNSIASFLYKSLKECGHDVFKADERMRAGENFSDAITNWITSSDFFIVLLTKASTKGGRGWVAAETELARQCEGTKGHPQILSVVANIEPPLHVRFEAAIGHLHHLQWHNVTDNPRLIVAILEAMADRQQRQPVVPRNSVRITESLWQSDGTRTSLAGTTVVPVVADEESTLVVTRASGPGSFRVRVLASGHLEVAIWSAASYRRVDSDPDNFIEMIENDNHTWCFERHEPDQSVLLESPSGSDEPIAVIFDTEVVKAVWGIAHKRVTSQEERFLIVMKHP